MKTKILYVLVSTESDIFAEQTYLSIQSLRKHNNSAIVSLIMDNKTALSVKERKFELLKIVDEPIVVDLPDNMTNKFKSRVLKTNMRNYVKGDILYIDSDTIVLSDISEIDNVEFDIAAVNELNRPFVESTCKTTLSEIYNRLGEDINSIKDYFNSGVIYIKDNEQTRSFFTDWNKLWEDETKKGVFFDQPSLGLVNARMGNVIGTLDGTWNCQGRYSVNFVQKAKIFHYLYDQGFEFPLLKKKAFDELKTHGVINSDLQKVLDDPYGNISTNNIIITDDDVVIFGSKLYSLIRNIYNHKQIYKLMEGMLNKAYSIILSLKSRNLVPPR